MKNILLPAFAIVAVLNLIAEIIGNQILIFSTKPFLMPLLALWLALGTDEGAPRFLRQSVLAGLVFATVGDILMMFAGGAQGALFFLLGLAAFLLTQLSYSGGFLSVDNLKNGYLWRQPAWIFAFFMYPLVLLWELWPGVPPGMRLPVGVYAVVITVMALSALNLRGRIASGAFWLIFTGALLFILSDSMIALDKFKEHRDWSRVAIMATYIAAQFLIVKGVKSVGSGTATAFSTRTPLRRY